MFLVETTMALVEDNGVFASRQFDMGDSGQGISSKVASLEATEGDPTWQTRRR